MKRACLILLLLTTACSQPVDRVVVELFAERDADGDGKLTAEEFGVGPAVFGELDRNGDGKLSRREAQASLDRWRRGPNPTLATEVPPGSRLLADRRYAADAGVASHQQSLDLWRPEGDGPFPVVLVLHGGGWVIGDKAELGVVANKVPFFNGRGYAVASANYRLSPGVKHPEHVRDVARAIGWIRDHAAEHDLDGERIVLVGHSSGAHLAALVATDPRWLAEVGGDLSWISGAILLDGTGYDLPRLLESDLDPRVREMVHTAFGHDLPALEDGSPFHQLDEQARPAPMLILHVSDRALSTDQGERLAGRLREVGGVAYVVPIEGTHGSIDRDLGLRSAPITRRVARFVDRRIGRPPTIVMDTELGRITAALDHRQAPLTADNFHDHLLDGNLDEATFYRTVRDDNQPGSPVTIDVIQGGLLGPDFEAELPFEAIAHETTAQTGLLHTDGALSMARMEPGTAQTEFFICVGPQPELDFGGRRNPDGQGFAVFGKVAGGFEVVREIHRAPADGQFLDPLIAIEMKAGFDDTHPAWSPDGEWLLFDSDRAAGGLRQLFAIRPDGTGLTQLTHDAQSASHPAWSPDGRTIVYAWANDDGGADLATLPFDLERDRGDVAGRPRRLTAQAGVSGRASFSPDGAWLAYISSADGDAEIWVARDNGSEARRLTDNEALDVPTAWSPDGEWLHFHSDRDGNLELYRLRVADGETERLTETPDARELLASWLPDGSRLTFWSDRSGALELWASKSDGRIEQWTTDAPGTGVPSWSPDGRRLAFFSYRDGQADLWVMQRDGRGQRRLTFD